MTQTLVVSMPCRKKMKLDALDRASSKCIAVAAEILR